MTNITLPKLNQTGANEWADVQDNDEAIKKVVNGGLDNGNLAAGAGIARSKLEAAARGIVGTWYTPKVIATEESRENTAFGTLTTADEIKGVVLPENGLVAIGYSANFKSSIAAAGRAAIFLGSNQLKIQKAGGVEDQETATTETTNYRLTTSSTGLQTSASASAADVTTGQILAAQSGGLGLGGLTLLYAAGGTYDISVRYKATSGSVTAKERKLWVAVLGG